MVDPGRVRRLLEALAGYRIVHESLRAGLDDLSRFGRAIARLAAPE